MIVITILNSNIAKDEMSKSEYRSFKGFNQQQFLSDLQGIGFSFVQDAEGVEMLPMNYLNLKYHR